MIDEKAAFYLRHRKEIEEWSALRSSAARLVGETLVSRFSDWSGDVDGTVRSTADLLDGAWPRVYCAGREWREQGLRLAVVLEWNRSRLCRLPPAWDRSEGFSATVMGPPGCQSWDHPACRSR